jgi:hypothetical protein
MPIPTKKEDLEAMGYVFDNDGVCRGCGQPIEWWITPKDKKMPMSVVDVKDETKAFPQPILRIERVPHWGVCPNADDFRRRK